MLLLGIATACDPAVPEHPLHRAVVAGDIAAVKRQLEKGAKIDDGPLNALHRAIIAKDIKMAELLIAHGADIEKRTAAPYKLDKFTPLVLAIHGGSAEMVTLLLKSGADPTIHAGTHDYPPLQWALIMAVPEPASALLAHLTLKQLEEEHVLHQVAASLTPSLITDLAKRKVDLNAKNENGDTALHVAVKSGPVHIDAVGHGEAVALLRELVVLSSIYAFHSCRKQSRIELVDHLLFHRFLKLNTSGC